jgi:heme-degrading monooxygenase HmoA
MAVLASVRLNDVTAAEYDEVFTKLAGDTPSLQSFPGMIFHSAVETADGFQIYDVWESENAFQTFMQEKAGPAMASMENPPTPKIEIVPVHNYLK